MSVREAVRELSVGKGQGYLKCACTGTCATNRCSCKAAKLACSSKCHGKAVNCRNSADIMPESAPKRVSTRKPNKKN